jgi:hypothetical protein
MSKTNIEIAETFYTLMGKKDIGSLEQYVHPDIHFIAPLGEAKGNEAYLEKTKFFMDILKTLSIRSIFESGDQVMFAYNVDFPEPFGVVRSAALMTFDEGLIKKVELFYDARPFV